MEFLRFDFLHIVIYSIFFSISLVFLYLNCIYFKGFEKKNFFTDNKGISLINIKTVLYIISFIFLSIAFFGPVIDFISFTPAGISKNIIFVIDLSKSMDAQDVSIDNKTYSRLEASKVLISEFITKNQENNYGLISFANTSLKLSPLTGDIDQIQTYLYALNTSTISGKGTNISSVFDFIKLRKEAKDAVNFIILSDGEDLTDNDLSKLSGIINKENTRIFTVGVGTVKGANVPDGNTIYGYAKYKIYDGERVVSKLNKTALSGLASNGGGIYLDGDNKGVIKKFEKDFLSENSKKVMLSKKASDSGYYFVVIGLLLITTSYFLNFKKR